MRIKESQKGTRSVNRKALRPGKRPLYKRCWRDSGRETQERSYLAGGSPGYPILEQKWWAAKCAGEQEPRRETQSCRGRGLPRPRPLVMPERLASDPRPVPLRWGDPIPHRTGVRNSWFTAGDFIRDGQGWLASPAPVRRRGMSEVKAETRPTSPSLPRCARHDAELHNFT